MEADLAEVREFPLVGAAYNSRNFSCTRTCVYYIALAGRLLRSYVIFALYRQLLLCRDKDARVVVKFAPL